MIASLLIANRGEIARRVIRTCRRLGIRTIAVFSEADASLPFVREADEAHCIGPAPARESYLVQSRLLDVAARSGAEAIHPGYGFLSENADFAEAVQAAGLVWIGAPPKAIRAMGLKDAAKKLMADSGVPVTPGYLGEDQSERTLKSEADAIGYPVLIKAVAGGGGKGMRLVEKTAGFKEALASCRREAAASFGDDRVLIEKYVTTPRHIEVQVFGDALGNVVHLFERDCSIQRRHQKVIEEAPAPGLDEATRAAICAAAVKAARAVDYVGAGTIEFIADASEGLRADRIWFMEMNTRLQVEHPVTEMITGLDLVEWQIRVASGEPLPLKQDEIKSRGWAIEARLYAENAASDFLPSIGPLRRLRFPDGIRIDSAVEEGDEVTPYYDPMIAKLIASGGSREAAAHRLAAACEALEVWPVKTNAGFLARCLGHGAFKDGEVHTGFIAAHLDALKSPQAPPHEALSAAARALVDAKPGDPWRALSGFRMAAAPESRVDIRIGDHTHTARRDDARAATVARVGDTHLVFHNGDCWEFASPRSEQAGNGDESASGAVYSPMPGRVLSVDVAAGQHVSAGQRLLAIEAMKMEHVLTAPFDGVVAELAIVSGQQVSEGALVARIVADHVDAQNARS